MLTVEVADNTVRAVDPTGPSLSVDVDGWDAHGRAHSFPLPTDRTETGVTDCLRLPPVFVSVMSREGDQPMRQFGTVGFDDGSHLLRVDGPVVLYVRFDGEAVLTNPGYGPTKLSFEAEKSVSLGFVAERVDPGTVTVPRTVEGVATALTYAGVNHRTLTAERSRPDMRGRPPRIRFGPESVPREVESRRPVSDVRLLIPDSLDHAYAVASLAFYLGATVSVEDVDGPRLSLPGESHAFRADGSFGRSMGDLLRRVFFLDCLVRARASDDTDLAESALLDDVGLAAGPLYRADVATRTAAYLDAPFERISDRLPEWHLSMYVDPSYSYLPALSHLLQNVPNVLLPESTPLASDERLTRSLDDFYRAPRRQAAGVNPLKPVLGPGRSHGWLAEGIPIDVFKAIPEAYDNRPDQSAERDTVSVVTVLNDIGMSAEFTDAASIYADHANESLDATVKKRLTVDELATVFESEHDLVHYIGHCDTDGLRCLDGNLPATDLSHSGAETFILNACGSYYEGIELVRKGSVAGAVTFEKVLDSHATRVGTAFARLLVHGFSIGRAIELARRRIIMSKDYAVVGDGTYALTRTGADVPVIARLDPTDDGRYALEYEASSPRVAGGWYRPPRGVTEGSTRLHGSSGELTLDADAMAAALEHADVPVIHDGDIHWSDDVAATLVDSG